MADSDAPGRAPAVKKSAAERRSAPAGKSSRKGAKGAGAVTSAATAVKSELPYVMNTGRIPNLFNQIQHASVPPRVTFQFLKHLGFSSSNDRAFTSLLRKIGFTDTNGVPTDRYRRYRNPDEAGVALAEGIRELYADLYAVNAQLEDRDVPTIRGIVSRVTGIDARRANLVARTFKTLADLADFDVVSDAEREQVLDFGQAPAVPDPGTPVATPEHPKARTATGSVAFRYNIEIHLPATTDIAVYNAIFRSLRDHLTE